MRAEDINALYKSEYQRLLYSSYRITKDMQLAEDVVQETFIKVIRKKDSIQDNTKLSAWLSVIAKRTAIDLIRKERITPTTAIEDEDLAKIIQTANQMVEEEVEYLVLLDQVKNKLLNLNEIYQEVMLLKVDAGLNAPEIAKQLNLKTASVKTRLLRARKHLTEMLQAQVTA